MVHKSLNIIFGGAGFGNPSSHGDIGTDEGAFKVFDLLKKNGCTQIDSAKIYGESEKGLGHLKATQAPHSFTVDTKWPGGFLKPGSMTKDEIIKLAEDSLAKLGVQKVHIFYMHSPDTGLPVEQTLEGIKECYKRGMFDKFGLSNYSTAQVQEVYDVCSKNGWVKPTVYQGPYSPVDRKSEEDGLLALLRKLGIAFNAYSPLAGGFLVKSRAFVQGGEGRFAKDKFFGLYGKLYGNEGMLQALEAWENIAADEGVSRAALAYRWVAFHSPLSPEHGDGMVIGGKLSQLEETFEALKAGPLGEKAAERVEEVWKTVSPKIEFASNVDALQAAIKETKLAGQKKE